MSEQEDTAMAYDERWYICEILDSRDVPEPPDFSKVPETKREEITRRWNDNNIPAPEEWKLWGPQIPHYIKMGYMITVISNE